jgi:hypothetical protein
MVQVLKSSDPGVRKAANLQLEEERKKQRVKFRPAVLQPTSELRTLEESMGPDRGSQDPPQRGGSRETPGAVPAPRPG